LRRSTLTSWRKLAVAGIAGAATTLAFATPALACHAEFPVKPTAACATENTALVTWTVKPSDRGGKLQGYEFTVDGNKANGTAPKNIGEALPDNSKFTLTVSKGAKIAKLTVKVSTDRGRSSEINLNVIDWSACQAPVVPPVTPSSPAPVQPTTPPVASPSAPVSESPSVPVSPSESKSSAVAGASSSAAAGSLPVTGTSIGIIAGVATLLLGAGVAMFLIARRRRVRFTAA
jgi:hypothetical protein